jgi:hypothetical protein
MISILLSKEEVAKYPDIVQKGGGVLYDLNGQCYVLTHHHEGTFSYRGVKLSEEKFLRVMDSCCGGQQESAWLVCCEPGKYLASSLRGRYIYLTHVFHGLNVPEKGTLFTNVDKYGEYYKLTFTIK